MGTARVAVVTGGGSGIGRAVALALAREGWAVTVAGRRADALAETAARAGTDRVLAVPTDVTDPAAVRALFDRTTAAFGRVDLLFNNAGLTAPPVPIDELPVEKWNEIVGVNLTGAFLCLREAFRVMKAQTPRGGRIVNNGSISAHTPRPNSAPYTATKHAITGLTKAAALDGRAHGIAVGQIDIGNAATDMTGRMAAGVPQANGTVAAEPTMDVDHVARAVAYMAGLPPEANVLFLTVMATTMPFVGRGRAGPVSSVGSGLCEARRGARTRPIPPAYSRLDGPLVATRTARVNRRLIEDDGEAMRWAVRALWCASLAVCPVACHIMGWVYERPDRHDGPGPSQPWPADAVNHLLTAHLFVSVFATRAAVPVWGRGWWAGWGAVVAALVWVFVASVEAHFATTGVAW